MFKKYICRIYFINLRKRSSKNKIGERKRVEDKSIVDDSETNGRNCIDHQYFRMD